MRTAVLAALAIGCMAAQARALDSDLYGRVLKRYTIAVDDIASTRVDYAALRHSADWQSLIQSLRESTPALLRTRDERLAFWINAYNILAIDLVRQHYPVESIRSIGSFLFPVWMKTAGEIGGRPYTLDEIEDEILRPMGDPRIHGAIVCASLSCPPLRREPYRGPELDRQLEDNVRRWLANPEKGVKIDRTAGTLTLSPIFKWFSGDFRGGAVPFVTAHVPEGEARWIRAQGSSLRVRYFEYDWRLNDAAALGRPAPRTEARPPGQQTFGRRGVTGARPSS